MYRNDIRLVYCPVCCILFSNVVLVVTVCGNIYFVVLCLLLRLLYIVSLFIAFIVYLCCFNYFLFCFYCLVVL